MAGRRLLALVPLLVVVSVIVFALVHLVPGDPAETLAGERATAEEIDETRERLGLDDPVWVQYGRWLGDVFQGDLGQSLFSSQSVADAIWTRIPVTLSLMVLATAFALLVGVPAGIIAGTRPGTWFDRVATLGATAGLAMPSYWLGLILLSLLAVNNQLLPASLYVGITESPVQWLEHLILPAVTLGTFGAAEITRQLRGSLADALARDYVRTARAKGLRRRSVIGKHALKNSLIPVVTVVGFQITFLLGGTVIAERIFGLPGIGDLAFQAVTQRDLPMIQGVVLVSALVAVVVNLLVDLSYMYFNPKVRGA